MKIAIFGKFYHKNSESSIITLLKILDNKNVEVFFDEQFYSTIKAQNNSNFKTIDFKTFNHLDNSFNLLISIGGDGTMLRAITYVRDYSIPIVGINTGRLGFLATIQKNNIENAIEDILNGNYHISERSLLTIKNRTGKQGSFRL